MFAPLARPDVCGRAGPVRGGHGVSLSLAGSALSRLQFAFGRRNKMAGFRTMTVLGAGKKRSQELQSFEDRDRPAVISPPSPRARAQGACRKCRVRVRRQGKAGLHRTARIASLKASVEARSSTRKSLVCQRRTRGVCRPPETANEGTAARRYPTRLRRPRRG